MSLDAVFVLGIVCYWIGYNRGRWVESEDKRGQ